eukprot:m51a1_g566 putative non-processive endoglucanase (941) ;mRNA; f:505074-510552
MSSGRATAPAAADPPPSSAGAGAAPIAAPATGAEQPVVIDDTDAAATTPKRARHRLTEQERAAREAEKAAKAEQARIRREQAERERKAKEEERERKKAEREEKKKKAEEEKAKRDAEKAKRDEEKAKKEAEKAEKKHKKEEEKAKKEEEKARKEEEKVKKETQSAMSRIDRFLQVQQPLEQKRQPTALPKCGPFEPFETDVQWYRPWEDPRVGAAEGAAERVLGSLYADERPAVEALAEQTLAWARERRRRVSVPLQRRNFKLLVLRDAAEQRERHSRPPWRGTWSKRSSVVRARRPLARDETLVQDYDAESDLDWEDPEDGEDIDSEGLVSDDEDAAEDEGDFVVPDGHLSEEERDGEVDPIPEAAAGPVAVAAKSVCYGVALDLEKADSNTQEALSKLTLQVLSCAMPERKRPVSQITKEPFPEKYVEALNNHVLGATKPLKQLVEEFCTKNTEVSKKAFRREVAARFVNMGAGAKSKWVTKSAGEAATAAAAATAASPAPIKDLMEAASQQCRSTPATGKRQRQLMADAMEIDSDTSAAAQSPTQAKPIEDVAMAPPKETRPAQAAQPAPEGAQALQPKGPSQVGGQQAESSAPALPVPALALAPAAHPGKSPSMSPKKTAHARATTPIKGMKPLTAFFTPQKGPQAQAAASPAKTKKADTEATKVLVIDGILPASCWSGSHFVSLPPKYVDHIEEGVNYAKSIGLLVYPALMSFDWGRGQRGHTEIFTDPAARQSWIDNAVAPIVERLKGNAGVFGWDLMNEPEWIVDSTDGGDRCDDCARLRLADLKAFLNSEMATIRGKGAKQPISLGSASLKYLTQKRLWNDLDLDFWDFHWYSWATQWFNPLLQEASKAIVPSKPVIIGEVMPDPSQDSVLSNSANRWCDGQTCTDHGRLLARLAQLGYSGYMPWAWTDPNFVLEPHIGNHFLMFNQNHPQH